LLAIENVTRALAANRLAEGQEGELRRTTIELTLILALVFGALLTALGFFGGELVTTIYGEDYAGQHTVHRVLGDPGPLEAVVRVDRAQGVKALVRGRLRIEGCEFLATKGHQRPMISLFRNY